MYCTIFALPCEVEPISYNSPTNGLEIQSYFLSQNPTLKEMIPNTLQFVQNHITDAYAQNLARSAQKIEAMNAEEVSSCDLVHLALTMASMSESYIKDFHLAEKLFSKS